MRSVDKHILSTLLITMSVWIIMADLSVGSLEGRYDAATYLSIIKAPSSDITSPNPQTLIFLKLAKLEHTIIGDGVFFYTFRLILLAIFLLIANRILIIGAGPFIPYLFMYSKEAYIIMILLLSILMGRKLFYALLLPLRPQLIPITLIAMARQKYLKIITFLYITIYIVFITEINTLSYIYQQQNISAYSIDCVYLISFCVSNDPQISTHLLRFIFFVPLYILKSIFDLQNISSIAPTDVMINLTQALSSLVFSIVIVCELTRSATRDLIHRYIAPLSLVAIISITMFINSERLFDLVKLLFLFHYYISFNATKKERARKC